MADITFLQILDTSIKIGLGALISGATTYWVTKLNHQKDIEKHTIHRKQELVEQVVTEFEDYWNGRIELYAKAIALISNDPITSTMNWLEKYKVEIDKSAEATKKTFHAQSLLLLLGEQNAAELITKIRYMGTDETTIAIQAFENKAKGLATPAENKKMLDSLKEIRRKVTEERKNLYGELRTTYNRIVV